MHITDIELILLFAIGLLLIIIAKQQSRIKNLMVAGGGLTFVLKQVAEGKGVVTMNKDGEMLFKQTGDSDASSKQD
jgi:hypothetical protein